MEIKTFPVRKPVVAGLFYERSRERLARIVDEFVAGATASVAELEIKGVIAPHAGYMYSGRVAGEVYGLLKGRAYDTVVVLAPSHSDHFHGASVYVGDYMTPLGIITVDSEVIELLLTAEGPIKAMLLGHREEHALEVQLPFLQRVLSSFRLVPIVIGTQDWETCEAIGRRLGAILNGRRALIVASSDLSHFHSDSVARQLDRLVVEDVEALAEQKLYKDIRLHKCEACGAGPIVAAIIAAKALGATHAQVVSYHTSGEINHEYEEVVGYMSGIMYKDFQ